MALSAVSASVVSPQLWFTPRFTFLISLSHCHMAVSLLAFGLCQVVAKRSLPSRLALCDLEAPGWGGPRFPHCAVLLLKLTDCGIAFS